MTAETVTHKTPGGKLKAWLLTHRTSSRLAFLFNLITRAVSAVMSFVWTPLLLHAMGGRLYGLFITFQAIPQLGGLGDLGIGGAIGNRAGRMVGRSEYDQLREFLASARSLFLLLGLAMGLGFLILSPWLPHWFRFEEAPGSGSLSLLFATGAMSLFLMIVGGYIWNLNAAYGMVAWPILPGLIISQLGMMAQWLLARAGVPLWEQNLAYVGVALANLVSVWLMLRAAHPWLAEIRPLKINLALWRDLASASGWMYLYMLGGMIFLWTDRLLVNAGFGSAAVTPYQLNYKPCEIILQLVLAAGFVSLPKFNQWIASGKGELLHRARSEGQRLNLIQSLAGTSAALGYLAFNYLFIQIWVGPANHAAASLQWAFALTMAVTAGSDAGVQIIGICGKKGLRTAGLAIGGFALLNFGLSFLAMRMGYMVGIAWATVIAQSLLSLTLAWHTCRHLEISYARWAFRAWALPVLVVLAGVGLQQLIGCQTGTRAGLLALALLPLVVLHAWAGGLNWQMLRDELAIFRRFLPGGKTTQN
jgi:O-antigen/teichoic acid export membrane protein